MRGRLVQVTFPEEALKSVTKVDSRGAPPNAAVRWTVWRIAG